MDIPAVEGASEVVRTAEGLADAVAVLLVVLGSELGGEDGAEVKVAVGEKLR